MSISFRILTKSSGSRQLREGRVFRIFKYVAAHCDRQDLGGHMFTVTKLKLLIIASMAFSQAYAGGATPIEAKKLLVALEGGNALQLDPADGRVLNAYKTGSDAFGAVYSKNGQRAFVTDKTAGTLSEIDPKSNAVLATISVGSLPQQPIVTSDNRLFIPMSGDAGIAVVDVSSAPNLIDKISTGEGTKPHILSLSPDEKYVWATVQGKDPKVIAISLSDYNQKKEFKYDLVPRILSATLNGAFYTAHHSTGLHFANLKDGTVSTPYMDEFGSASEARKQIEGVSASADGKLVAITHEGKKSLVMINMDNSKICRIGNLIDKPYWVTLDTSNKVAFISIPGAGLVEAYNVGKCQRKPLWSSKVGGKPKRMDISRY